MNLRPVRDPTAARVSGTRRRRGWTVALLTLALALVAGAAFVVAIVLRANEAEPREPRPVVIGDFERAVSPWGHGRAAAPPGGLTIAGAPVAHGEGSLRSTVVLGRCIASDQAPDGTCRRYHSNAVHRATHGEGEDTWWGWSMFLPSDWRPNVLSWNLLAQFHPPAHSDSRACQPNITLGTDGPDTLFVRSEGGPSCVSDQQQTKKFAVGELGRWHRFVLHTRFSSGSDGLIEAWWDGTEVASMPGPTLYGELGEVFGPMLGIYEGGKAAVAQTVFYDYVVTGPTRLDVESVPGSGD